MEFNAYSMLVDFMWAGRFLQAFREVMVRQQHLARHSAHLDGKMQRIWR